MIQDYWHLEPMALCTLKAVFIDFNYIVPGTGPGMYWVNLYLALY